MPEDEGPRPLSADSVARELRQARADSGQDLDSIAQGLRIRYDYLLAIEDGRYEDLPGPTYAVGFVRAYADYLHLDGESIANRFKAEVADFTGKTELHFPSPPPEGRLPGGSLIIISAVLIAGAYGAWYFLSNQPDRIAERSSVPEVTSPALPEVAPPAAPEAQVEAPAATQDGTAAVDPSDSGGIADTGETPASDAVDPAPAPVQGAAEVPEPQPAEEPAVTETAAVPDAPEAATAAEPDVSDPATAAAETAPDAEAETAAPASETETSQTETSEAGAGAETAAEATPAESPAEAATEPEPAASEPEPEVAQTEPEPVLDNDTVEAEAAEVAAGSETDPAESPEVLPQPEPIEVGVAPLPPPRRPETQVQPEPVQTADLGETGESEVLGAENGNSRIVVRAVFDSYVLIRDADDKLLLTKVLRRGDSYRVPDQSGLTMLTGNAGGLQIEVDGQQAPAVGAVGAIVRNISLDPQRLQSGTAVNR